MKRITCIAILLLVCACTMLNAQERDKHNYEAGIGLNVYGILGMEGGPSRNASLGAYFEYRYDYAEHFDFGGQINYTHGKGRSAFTGEPTWGIVYNQINLKGVADYNICPKRAVSPYIGAGLGCGVLFTARESEHGNSVDKFGIVGPRIGLQIWRIRTALEFNFAFGGGYSGFLNTESSTALNISYTF